MRAIAAVAVTVLSLSLPGASSALSANVWSGSQINPRIWGLTLAPPSPGYIELQSISCAARDVCVAVGGGPENVKEPHGMKVRESGYALALGVRGWQAPIRIEGELEPRAVSCPSPTFCVAVGNHARGANFVGYAATYNGRAWSRPQTIVAEPLEDEHRKQELQFVSCASRSFCAAANAAGQVIVYNGSEWQQAVAGYPRAMLRSLACPGASDCQAIMDLATPVETSGNVTSGGVFEEAFTLAFDGTGWQTPAARTTAESFVSLACPTVTYCAVGTNHGEIYSYDGVAWSGPIGPGGPFTAPLSCASASFCVGIGWPDTTITFDGRTWELSEHLAPSGAFVLGGGSWGELISCAEPSFCLAISGSGARYYPATAAPPGSESRATLRTRPASARPGQTVRVEGSVHIVDQMIDCQEESEDVELFSHAFAPRSSRTPGIKVSREPSGTFSATVRIRPRARRGHYAVSAVFCGEDLGARASLRVFGHRLRRR